jgi:hypothetical protein
VLSARWGTRRRIIRLRFANIREYTQSTIDAMRNPIARVDLYGRLHPFVTDYIWRRFQSYAPAVR